LEKNKMMIRSIEEINQKIKSGDATVLTAEEVSTLVREGNTQMPKMSML
jgi:uncharacterized protein (DUF39 family)